MYSYVVHELPALIGEHFPVQSERQGIFGHSMGGHGALVCALRNLIATSQFQLLHQLRHVALGSEGLHPLSWLNKENWRAYDASNWVLTVGYNRRF